MLKPITGVVIALLFTLAIVSIAYVCADVENSNSQSTKLIRLPDNSDVLLESNSSINYNHLGWFFKRELKLSGDALFNVRNHHDFIVKTNCAKIIGLCTQFYISQYQNKLRVECYEGSILVKTDDGNITIEKNQRLLYQPGKVFYKESLFHENTEVYQPQITTERFFSE